MHLQHYLIFEISEKRINTDLKDNKVVKFRSPNYIYTFSIGFI